MNDEIVDIEAVFLKERDGGDVFAYFHDDLYCSELYPTCHTCYAHVGQHSACEASYAAGCRVASRKEYTPLLDELTSIGYNVHILGRAAWERERAEILAANVFAA